MGSTPHPANSEHDSTVSHTPVGNLALEAHPWLWHLYLIVFISSGCIMILELVAGRIIAPWVGVSLYTWTSVIGVVLAGISLGNYLGGWLADRHASLRLWEHPSVGQPVAFAIRSGGCAGRLTPGDRPIAIGIRF
jgi:hypothetical protein